MSRKISESAQRAENNAFSGEIPPEVGRLQNLSVFGATGNNLTGRIPTEIGTLEYLYDLKLGKKV